MNCDLTIPGAEKRSFSLHPQMIWQVISSQAGSISKGLLEIVMNSIDAGATEVRITVDQTGYTARDNGCGFRDVNEIIDFFETFGFPHCPGDRQYGRFGQGRAQLWSFGSAIWRTAGETGTGFILDVDVKNRGLDYHLHKDVEGISPGCEIRGTWYEPLLPSEVDAEIRSLTEMALYATLPIFVNDKQITKDLRRVTWTCETDEAYILINPSKSSLSVYNLGVKVRDYPAYQFGTGGTVVSKQRLEVNVARNDVLLGRCNVFKSIREIIKRHSGAQIQRQGALNESSREFLARSLMCGEIGMQEVFEQRLITDTKGRHWPMSKLLFRAGGVFTVGPQEGDQVAETVHMRGLAFVLSPKTLARFGVENGQELVEGLRSLVRPETAWFFSLRNLRCEPFERFSAMFKEGYEPLRDKELTVKERVVLKALNAAQSRPVRYAFRVTGNERMPRAIHAGLSETALAWTDGESLIFVHRSLLELAYDGVQGVGALCALIAHEYVHDSSDANSHAHDQAFYELYEAVVANPRVNLVGMMSAYVIDALGRELRSASKRLPKPLATAEDRIAAIAQNGPLLDQ